MTLEKISKYKVEFTYCWSPTTKHAAYSKE